MSERSPSSSGDAADEARDGRRRPREEPVLPDRAAEDRPEAWGERPDDDDEHYLRDRPPHW